MWSQSVVHFTKPVVGFIVVFFMSISKQKSLFLGTCYILVYELYKWEQSKMAGTKFKMADTKNRNMFNLGSDNHTKLKMSKIMGI